MQDLVPLPTNTAEGDEEEEGEEAGVEIIYADDYRKRNKKSSGTSSEQPNRRVNRTFIVCRYVNGTPTRTRRQNV